ncbi:aldo/keto reductase [Niveibacterium sp. SC-1]|uniref:aldo/keto reductase n=1 Tax=Niveibacterium sp. SC-1 TaxID=3135646 RepID=UPI00311FC2DC
MDYVNLGRSGLKVSRLCLGMMSFGTPRFRPWMLDEAASRPVVQRAVELGINFFDTADMYSGGESEVLTGRFVREFMRRDEVVVATKVYNFVDTGLQGAAAAPRPNDRGLSRKRILHAVDASLQRLGLDYIDLYQIHRWDYATPIEETMEALHEVVKAGKVRYLGASSMWAWQFAKAQQVAEHNGWTRFISMQNHYNLAYREEEREMNPLCLDQGVGLIPWSPLARGFLAGNRRRGEGQRGGDTLRAQTDDLAKQFYFEDADFAVLAALETLAAERGVSCAQLAYAWLLHQPGVTAPIVGCSRAEQLDDALASCALALSPTELQRLAAPYTPHAIVGHQ